MKVILSAFILTFVLTINNTAVAKSGDTSGSTNVATTAALNEAKYDRLMRTFVNKLKLAFVQESDAQTLEILNQYASVFSAQTDALKNDLLISVKEMPKADVEALYKRITNKSRSSEMVALLYDARVVSRLQTNPEIQKAVDALQAKSLEIQKIDLLAVK